MSASDLRIMVAPDGGHRRLECRGVTIRLLTEGQIQALSLSGFKAYWIKFHKLKVAANLDEDWLWGDDPTLADQDDGPFKAFDYLRHALRRECNRIRWRTPAV